MNILEKQPQNKTAGYICVVSGIFMHLFLGNLYLWGNISTYVVSYYHYNGNPGATEGIAIICLPLSFTI